MAFKALVAKYKWGHLWFRLESINDDICILNKFNLYNEEYINYVWKMSGRKGQILDGPACTI